MQYILTPQEYAQLTSITRLQDRNEVLDRVRNILLQQAGIRCDDTTRPEYCDDCPVYKYFRKSVGHSQQRMHNYICLRRKSLHK